MRYEVTSPDGKKYEITAPDGASQEQVLTYARTQFAKQERKPAKVAPQTDIVGTETPAEAVAGNPATRFAMGVASPFLGAMQLQANMNPLARMLGLDTRVNESLATLEGMKRAGMREADQGTLDVAGLSGSVLNPAGLGAAKAIPAAGGMLQRMLQGAGVGATMGAATPVTDGGDNFTISKLLQGGMGAGVGALAAPVGSALGAAGRRAYNLIEPHLPGGIRRVAGRTAVEMAGPRAPQVIAEMERAQQIVPGSAPIAGEAAVNAGSAEIAALQKIAQARMPSEYDAIARAQDAARVAQVRTVGRTPSALDAARKIRAENAAENYNPQLMQTRVSPDSQTAIMENAIRDRYMSRAAALQDQGRFATTAAQNEQRAANFVPVEGMPRVSGRASNFPDRAQEAAQAAKATEPVVRQRMAEEQFLRSMQEQLQATVGLENRSLHEFLGRPSVKRAIKEAADSAAETGAYFPSKPGDNFTVENLQRIKQAIADDISKNPAVQGLGATQKREVTGTMNEFTQWLSNKQPDWAKARIQYAEDSIPINQMQIGQELESKLVPALADVGASPAQRAAGYAQALRDAAGTIKRATGEPRYDDLSKILNPDQIRAVTSVAEDLARKARYEQLAREGNTEAARLLGQQFQSPVQGMNPLERTTMIVKGIINRLEGRAGEKTLAYIADKMRDPVEFAKIMKAATPAQRRFLIESISAQASASAAARGQQEPTAE